MVKYLVLKTFFEAEQSNVCFVLDNLYVVFGSVTHFKCNFSISNLVGLFE